MDSSGELEAILQANWHQPNRMHGEVGGGSKPERLFGPRFVGNANSNGCVGVDCERV